MEHKGRIALVTGAGRAQGIGAEVAGQLATHGFKVILTARQEADATARAQALQAKGLDVIGEQLDVTDATSLAGLAKDVESLFGRVDVLINNAAQMGPYADRPSNADLETAHKTVETILFGAWATAQTFLPLLRRSAHPRLVNVSSGAGSHADPAFGLTSGTQMGVAYAVAKAALNALTVKQAIEERDHKVLVNAVCPGWTATFEGGREMGARPLADGAASVVWAALLPDDGPTGGFFRDGVALGW